MGFIVVESCSMSWELNNLSLTYWLRCLFSNSCCNEMKHNMMYYLTFKRLIRFTKWKNNSWDVELIERVDVFDNLIDKNKNQCKLKSLFFNKYNDLLLCFMLKCPI